MSSRREFIRSGALAIGVVAGGGAFAAAEARDGVRQAVPSAPLPLYAVVFDDRFPESRAFAAAMRARNLRTESLDQGDVTRLWYDDLYHRWKEGPAAIAGLTTPNALFVLETFGNDAGLRLQFKAEHRPLEKRIDHRLYGSASMLRSALPLETSGNAWSAHMGRVVGAGEGRFGRSEARLVTPLSADASNHGHMLVSWVLAPRAPRGAATLTI